MTDKEFLIQLNHDIRNAEYTRNSTFMEKQLADDLVFRRANGSFADKKTYLCDLKDINNTYENLNNIEIKVDIDQINGLAIATVIVKAKGKRGKEQKPFNGVYKNIRFFRKNVEWELYAWYNEVISNYLNNLIIHIPKAEEIKINYKYSEDGNMCGQVLMEVVSGLPSSPYTRFSYVRFENGARTKWHKHDGVQILLVTESIGFVEQKGYPSFDINPGDRIYIPENVWHRHGAKVGQTMVHLAITNGETEWDYDDPCK